MKYSSTRGQAPVLDFEAAVMQGLAADGGLYLPQTAPQFSAAELRAMRALPYAELAEAVMAPFIGESLPRGELRGLIAAAYSGFHHAALCPLIQLDEQSFALELFHGPTLAFKDIAMQFLARLMEHFLAKRGKRATIIGATSGDTGGAAIEAFADSENADIFILFPQGRVSPFQQWQMTCNGAANAHALAVDGNFDDCQNLVKALFNDQKFRADYALSGVNSINWARIMAQIPYYFAAAFKLGAPERPVSFTVPTGNFGDIFAGFMAHKMGLPIERLVIATNENDILARALASGIYQPQALVATTSPSMDIQISSNFERLLFMAGGEDAALTARQQRALAEHGGFTLEERQLAVIKSLFSAGSCNREQTEQAIARVWRQSAYLADPHTAAALHCAAAYAAENPHSAAPIAILATAHPAKFPQAVERAAGVLPRPPAWAKEYDAGQEKYTSLPADLAAAQAYIARHSRARPAAEDAISQESPQREAQ